MGVLQRFERRLEGLVEGAFAKVFGGVVQPVEVAAALQREAEAHKTIVGAGRILVPNDFLVELSESDAERLEAYDAPLRRELSAMVHEHGDEQGWSFLGPVTVRFEQASDLSTGVFRVRSDIVEQHQQPSGPYGNSERPDQNTQHSSGGPRPTGTYERPRPYLVVVAGGSADHDSPEGRGQERVFPLTDRLTRVGRGAEAELRLADTGVSRLHAEILLDGDEASVRDLGSTNGTSVNGRQVTSARLHDGDRINVGTTGLVFTRER